MQTYNFDRLFTGEVWLSDGHLVVSGGVITHLGEGKLASANHYLRGEVIPGLIDVQVNGGGGILLNQSPSVSGLEKMFAAHASFGTSAMLPTLITDDIEVIEQTAEAIANAKSLGGILGVHFEGPHLSVPKKGAHSGEKIRPISDREWAVYERADLGIKHVTVAAECVSTQDIKRLVNNDVIVSIGHSNASYEQTVAAVDAGATGFTHLFNAMSPFTSREPGVVGAALLEDDTWCGIICDGHHVSWPSLLLALKAKPQGKMMLVTDAMSLIGTDANEFDFFNRKVIRDGDRLTSTTGELAGSHLDMISAVKNTVENLQVTREEAIRMASLYPAQFLKRNDLGRIAVGSKANLTILREEFLVDSVYLQGEKV